MNKPVSRVINAIILLLVILPIAFSTYAQDESPLVLVLTIDSAITPTTAEYLNRGIQTAEQREADLIILALNTPGGGLDSTQTIIEYMLASKVPIIVYVSPRGAMAGSAGTIITLAGHFAAMAPETAIGAASPVGAQGEDIGETMEAKQKEIMKAQVRSLAKRRGEEATALAEATIEEAKAASADEALEVNLIDFIAADQDELIALLNGKTANVNGVDIALMLENATFEPFNYSLIEQILQVLTNPNIVFILLTIGVQAILIELSNPGGWVAGFIGVVFLSLATYGLGVLPVNWFGLIFLATAFVLFALDIKAPTHGALTTAGIASLIAGALILFNSPRTPVSLHVSVPLVIITSLFTGGLFAVMVAYALRAQRTPIRTGQESFTGRKGKALTRITHSEPGMVQVGAETWTAELGEDKGNIEPDEIVEIISIEGVRAIVRKKPKSD